MVGVSPVAPGWGLETGDGGVRAVDQVKPLTVGEVFMPNRIPTITYNPRQSHKLEQAIRSHVTSPQEILLVLGPSKSGKTVLINKTIPLDRLVEVEGTQVRSQENAFWVQAAATLQLPREVTQSNKVEVSDASIGDGGITINLGFVSFTLNRKPKKNESSSTVTATRNLSSQSAILGELLKRQCVLVIDDFHVIDPQDAVAGWVRVPQVRGPQA